MSRAQRDKSKLRSIERSIIEQCEKNPVRLSPNAVEKLLNDLCIDLGYCLPPKAYEKIVNNPPTDPKSFSKIVMDLEGAGTNDRIMFQSVFECVCKVFLSKLKTNT